MTVYNVIDISEKPKLFYPDFKVRWIRGRDDFRFDLPLTFFTMGIRGSGKSTVLETCACQYLYHGHKILDLFGSRDGEGLAWLRSPYATTDNCLLIHGENIDVKSQWDTTTPDQLRMKDFEKYDIVISASPLYNGIDDQFVSAGKITDKLYNRLSWNTIVCVIAREASNLYYSRLKITDNQIQAKAQMTYLLKEARHMGMTLCLDTLRYYAIDIDIRSLSDYTFYKSQGIDGLSQNLTWLYAFFEPSMIRNMKPQFFGLTTLKGAIGYGKFNEITWHKKESENLLELLNIQVEYSEKPKQEIDRGRYKTVSDMDHLEIITLYDDGLGMDAIAESKERSGATTYAHISKHNKSVKKIGYCEVCRRVNSDLATKFVSHGK